MLADLFSRSTPGIKLGLEGTEGLLEALDHPERGVCNILVAGTNGKGSTSFMLAQGLTACGLRTGLFTSPHLLRFTERMRIDGVEATPDTIVRLHHRLVQAEARAGIRGTFFESATVLSALAFAEAEVDVAVYEVGLGGRLDATNAISHDLVLITPISFDHTNVLGNTLGVIAGEKARTISRGGTAVVAPQPREVRAVIEELARQRQARIVNAYDVAEETDAGFVLRGSAPQAPLAISPPARLPSFQRRNLGTVAAACAVLQDAGYEGVSPARAVAHAAGCQWPGRFHWLSGQHSPIVLDGAHNPGGIETLWEALDDDPRSQRKPRHTVFTALRGKDGGAMGKRVGEGSQSVSLCPVSSARSRRGAELAALVPGAAVHEDFAAALRYARTRALQDAGIVVVTGSLFLVGDALAHLTSALRDPPVDG